VLGEPSISSLGSSPNSEPVSPNFWMSWSRSCTSTSNNGPYKNSFRRLCSNRPTCHKQQPSNRPLSGTPQSASYRPTCHKQQPSNRPLSGTPQSVRNTPVSQEHPSQPATENSQKHCRYVENITTTLLEQNAPEVLRCHEEVSLYSLTPTVAIWVQLCYKASRARPGSAIMCFFDIWAL